MSQRLADYLRAHPRLSEDQTELLETALFLEEELGIRLADEDICPDLLGSPEALRAFVSERLGQ